MQTKTNRVTGAVICNGSSRNRRRRQCSLVLQRLIIRRREGLRTGVMLLLYILRGPKKQYIYALRIYNNNNKFITLYLNKEKTVKQVLQFAWLMNRTKSLSSKYLDIKLQTI